MDRADLAEETGAKELEHPIDLDESAPEAMGGGSVIAGMSPVLRKPDRIGHLARHLVDRDGNADAVQQIDHAQIEIGNRLRLERQCPLIAAAGAGGETVLDEIKLHLEDFVADGDR